VSSAKERVGVVSAEIRLILQNHALAVEQDAVGEQEIAECQRLGGIDDAAFAVCCLEVMAGD
jgi:hypothetical protein